MTCPKNSEISAFMDDQLGPAERRGFAAHLEQCAVCREQANELNALRGALRALPSPALGFDLAARLEEQNRAQRRPRRRRTASSFWPSFVMPGVAVIAAAMAGAWLGGLLLGGATAPPVVSVRVFDPVPPGGLCAAAELCRASKGMQ